jgi:hypothetical protein
MNSWARRLVSKVWVLFRQRKAESEFDDEMQVHLQLLTEKFIRQGMRSADADSAARRQFGNTALLEQRHRESRTFLSFSALSQDLRYGVRVLGKSRGFTAISSGFTGIGNRREHNDLLGRENHGLRPAQRASRGAVKDVVLAIRRA